MSRLCRPEIFRARELRRSSTPAERVVWTMLRARRVDGATFQRQVPLGPYVADFFCAEVALVIEADGGVHVRRRPRDRARDAWLAAFGIATLRIANDDVLYDAEGVRERIRSLVRERRSPPLPQGPQGEGARG
jgi:very-short-patch-repair endonuclease